MCVCVCVWWCRTTDWGSVFYLLSLFFINPCCVWKSPCTNFVNQALAEFKQRLSVESTLYWRAVSSTDKQLCTVKNKPSWHGFVWLSVTGKWIWIFSLSPPAAQIFHLWNIFYWMCPYDFSDPPIFPLPVSKMSRPAWKDCHLQGHVSLRVYCHNFVKTFPIAP